MITMPTGPRMIPYLRIGNLKTTPYPTVSLYSPYMAVPPQDLTPPFGIDFVHSCSCCISPANYENNTMFLQRKATHQPRSQGSSLWLSGENEESHEN